ncbi:MAG: hypothetical protein ACLGI3_03430 [Actinomycetes bacterium]
MGSAVARMTAGLALGAGWGVLSSATNAATSALGAAASLVVNSGFA